MFGELTLLRLSAIASNTALRQFGELDALAHKPLNAFYDIPSIEHSDEARKQYEIAYRGTAAELFLEGH